MLDIWLPLIGGFVLLVAGGDLLVRGAVQVASRFGVSPLVIGLTLVGFGTSTPELVTSVQAALIGAPGIAYGNIVGSNIANMLLIVGVSAILYPIAISSAALRRDAAHRDVRGQHPDPGPVADRGRRRRPVRRRQHL